MFKLRANYLLWWEIMKFAHEKKLHTLDFGTTLRHSSNLVFKGKWNTRLEPVYEYLQRNNLPLTMHMGTTYARNAPVDMGRAIHVEPIALKYPDLTMVLAHMGHPWFDDAIVVARKQPNVWLENSALFYRPWQYYNMLVLAEEYRIADKIFFGTDFPFTTVNASIDGIRKLNDMLEGTKLPRLDVNQIEAMIHRDSLKLLGLQP